VSFIAVEWAKETVDEQHRPQTRLQDAPWDVCDTVVRVAVQVRCCGALVGVELVGVLGVLWRDGDAAARWSFGACVGFLVRMS